MEHKKLAELRTIAKDLRIPYYNTHKKPELIKLISERNSGDINRKELFNTLKRLGVYDKSFRDLDNKTLTKITEKFELLTTTPKTKHVKKLDIDPEFKKRP